MHDVRLIVPKRGSKVTNVLFCGGYQSISQSGEWAHRNDKAVGKKDLFSFDPFKGRKDMLPWMLGVQPRHPLDPKRPLNMTTLYYTWRISFRMRKKTLLRNSEKKQTTNNWISPCIEILNNIMSLQNEGNLLILQNDAYLGRSNG